MPTEAEINVKIDTPEMKLVDDLYHKLAEEGNTELQRIQKEVPFRDQMGAMYLAMVAVICKFIAQLPPVLNEDQAALVLGALKDIIASVEDNCHKLKLMQLMKKFGGLFK